MAPPLRKPRQKNVQSEGPRPRFTLRLSGPMAVVLGLMLAAAVGWSFFMGFMVGRGQNPETRVEQMTGMRQQEPPAPHAAAPEAPLPESRAEPLAADASAPDPAATPAGQAAGQHADGQAAAAAASPAQEGSPAARAQADAQKGQARQQAYPFARPSGDSLAAWGGKPPAQGAAGGPAQNQTRNQAQGQGQNPAQGRTQGQQQGGQPSAPSGQDAARLEADRQETAHPLYDFVFQVAAFKNQDDADNLRTRLEGKGLRSRLQKSGKVLLVMVNLRGTETDADNMREEMRRMKLGTPILASQKAVPGKSRKSGQR